MKETLKERRKALSGEIRRLYNSILLFWPPEFIGAICDLGVADRALVSKRLCYDWEHVGRMRKSVALLREFSLKYIKYLEALTARILSYELDAFGSNDPIPQMIDSEMENFLMLLTASTLQERQDLIDRYQIEGTYPKFLFPDRTARSLFSLPWIRRPGYYAWLQGQRPILRQSPTPRRELSPNPQQSSRKAKVASSKLKNVNALNGIAQALNLDEEEPPSQEEGFQFDLD